MNNKSILDEFTKVVKKVNKKYPGGLLFKIFKSLGGKQLQCLIIDSALKNISLENLHITLLLLEAKYYILVQDATVILKQMLKNKSIF